MLPKIKRISKGSKIKEILNTKQFHYTSPLFFFAALDNNEGTSRMKAVCSKKIGNAVQRNTTRRKIDAAMCSIWHKIAKNIDMVVIARTKDRKMDEYRNEFVKGLKKLGLLCQE